jgi:hypothetical protein
MINAETPRLEADGSEHPDGPLNLIDSFWTPDVLTSTGMEPLLRGAIANGTEANDAMVVEELRNVLFGIPGGGPVANGTDIAAIDIQRGRDHGLSDLNTIRAALGLAPYASFEALTGDPTVAAALSLAYDGDLSDLDLWAGLISEAHVAGGSFGETTLAILGDQFVRIRDGDRFFYLNDPDLLPGGGLDSLGFGVDYFDQLTLSEVIRNNSEIDRLLGLNGNAFFVPEPATAGLLAMTALVALRRRRH